MALTAYCDLDDLEDRLSVPGVDLRNDDYPPSVHGNAIVRASAKVNQHLLKRYEPTTLASNDWVRMVAADIAAFLLCTRRGNPAPACIAQAYKDALIDLKEIRKGEQDVPDAAPRRQSCPVMSNVRVNLTPYPHVRVTRGMSTTTGGTPRDYARYVDFLNDSWLTVPRG